MNEGGLNQFKKSQKGIISHTSQFYLRIQLATRIAI